MQGNQTWMKWSTNKSWLVPGNMDGGHFDGIKQEQVNLPIWFVCRNSRLIKCALIINQQQLTSETRNHGNTKEKFCDIHMKCGPLISLGNRSPPSNPLNSVNHITCFWGKSSNRVIGLFNSMFPPKENYCSPLITDQQRNCSDTIKRTAKCAFLFFDKSHKLRQYMHQNKIQQKTKMTSSKFDSLWRFKGWIPRR